MTFYTDITRKVLVLAIVCTMAFSSVIPRAEAQVIYQPVQNPTTIQGLIIYLYSLIAQLQAQQLATQQGVYYPAPQVLGYSTVVNSPYNVEVQTFAVSDTREDEIKLYGEIDLNNASYALVWFEYGMNGRLTKSTSRMRMDYSVSDTFNAVARNLEEDEKYHYRTVAEDPAGKRTYGATKTFNTLASSRNRSRGGDDEPDVDTLSARSIDEDSAELRGTVDMNDFRNGVVFFVYGEDEDQIEDVARDFGSYSDVDEDGDDLQKVKVDSDLDGRDSYSKRVSGLDDDTEYFFQICVAYEDEDDDDVIECGGVEDFETDRN